ncbi:MAG TPA: cysteine--tRNA ligase [Polyangia bacterium]|jgi:cysteinyl-tRNA synthetase
MSLRIYDTRQKHKIDFVPLVPGKVGLYACGITVYDICHVGHGRMLVAFDVIVRHLRASGFEVRFVRNVTDIDDKIIRRSGQEGISAEAVARKYMDAMAADQAALGIATPDAEPLATAHVSEIIELISRLCERGLAYPAGGDVYFSVGSFPSYGALSGQSTDDLKSGARIEIGEQKQSPLDFALWKAAKPGEPQWPSPWGPGRPGWHIECSAMSHTFLGDVFDIHGGGADLIFPHHENERAQSEGAFGLGTFAQHWLHSGMVNFGGEKMSKSLGNVVSIRRVGETHDLEALRLLFVSVHYRSPVSFEIGKDAVGETTFPDLDEAEARLDYFYRTLERLDGAVPAGAPTEGPVVAPADRTRAAFREAMDDDFNTAAAVGHLYESFVLANKLLDEPKSAPKNVRQRTLARLRDELRACGETLGIFRRVPSEFLLARRARLCQQRGIDAVAIEMRIVERTQARANKDFTRADELRNALKTQGIELMDSAAGTAWRIS